MDGKCLHKSMGNGRYIYNILFSKTGEKIRTQKKRKTSETVTAQNNKDLSPGQMRLSTAENENCAHLNVPVSSFQMPAELHASS